jgi:hypothetical protein
MTKVSIPQPDYGKPQPAIGMTPTLTGVASNEREYRERLTRHLHRTPSIHVASDTNFKGTALAPGVQRPKSLRGIRKPRSTAKNRDRTTNDVQDC